jgi:hypothetical protein
MKLHKTICFLTLIVFGCWQISCAQKEKTGVVTVSNPAPVQSNDALIVLKRIDIEKKVGVIATGKYVQVFAEQRPVIVQYDDMDGDGNWDEAVFLYSFQPKASVRFSFKVTDAPAAVKAVVRAHVRHRKKNADNSFGPAIARDTMPPANPPTNFSKVPLPPYLTEGPAWENDKVAFRLYFDTRNGKDIFAKRQPAMVMDTVGTNKNASYHALSDWGMDVLHVGRSLGAGSVAIAAKDADGKDTLIRLGGPNVKKEIYHAIADGPVRAVFTIDYEWEINGSPVSIKDETSIWGGQYFYETKLMIQGAPADATLVAGFADFYDNVPGSLDTAGTKIYYSYGVQSEGKDRLGMAIAVPAKNFAWYKNIKTGTGDIDHSYLVAQDITPGEATGCRFYSGWEKSDTAFQSDQGFRNYLEKQAVLMGMPLRYEW